MLRVSKGELIQPDNGCDMQAAATEQPLQIGDHRRSVIIAWLPAFCVTQVALQRVADPDGQTVSRNVIDEALASGSRGGSISGISGVIGGTTGATTDADSLDKEGYFIVEDSAGGFYLVGLAGLEPATEEL